MSLPSSSERASIMALSRVTSIVPSPGPPTLTSSSSEANASSMEADTTVMPSASYATV